MTVSHGFSDLVGRKCKVLVTEVKGEIIGIVIAKDNIRVYILTATNRIIVHKLVDVKLLRKDGGEDNS